MNSYEVIKRPLVTEKAMSGQAEANRYVFVVHAKANKHQIRQSVQEIFKVKVEKINTEIVRGKMRRVGRSSGKRSNWKKALVTLKAGETIKIFEGV